MRNWKQWLCSLLLCAVLLAGLCPTAMAEDGSIRDLDENGKDALCETYTTVTGSDTEWSGGWYVAENSMEIADRVTVDGTAHLILVNGCELEAAKGINVGEGKSLTIYAQSKAENAMGKLTAVGCYNGAGNGAGSMVTTSGGAVTVQSSKGADISGGFDAVNSNIAQSDKIEISEDATVTRPDGNALNIGPAEHQAKDEWAFDSTRHWHLCKAADCTENHQFNKAAHTPGDWIVDQAAATTETGRRHKECPACGYIMQTEAILPVHSPSYEQGWTSDASGRWHECACGDKSGCADHSFGKWTTDIPAAYRPDVTPPSEGGTVSVILPP